MENAINFQTLSDGGFAERANQAIQEVMKNIADPNTEWKAKRKVVLELTFEAKEDRQYIECTVASKVKLAPRSSIHTRFILDRASNGEVLASEFKKQLPGQTYMMVDSETGEIETIKEEHPTSGGLQVVK
jgi:hypothetical protein